MSVQFLVHQDGDSVGVITVEGIKAGQELEGWVMKEDYLIKFTVLDLIISTPEQSFTTSSPCWRRDQYNKKDHMEKTISKGVFISFFLKSGSILS